jgi:hypothetical protein
VQLSLSEGLFRKVFGIISPRASIQIEELG